MHGTGCKRTPLFLPNSASEAVSPNVGTMSFQQCNFDYVADIAVEINARAQADLDNARQIVCFPILHLHRDDIGEDAVRARPRLRENPCGKDFGSFNRFIARCEAADCAAANPVAGLLVCGSRERLNNCGHCKEKSERRSTKHVRPLTLLGAPIIILWLHRQSTSTTCAAHSKLSMNTRSALGHSLRSGGDLGTSGLASTVDQPSTTRPEGQEQSSCAPDVSFPSPKGLPSQKRGREK